MEWNFRAKVNKVLNYKSLDLTFDLGFSIKYRHDIILSGYDVDMSLQAEAKNCLILLIGGHRVIVRSEKSGEEYLSQVFLYSPIRFPNCYDNVGDKRLQCVNSIMSVLAQKNYSTDYLKGLLPDVATNIGD